MQYNEIVTICTEAGIGPVVRAHIFDISRDTELRWRKGIPGVIRNKEKYNLCIIKAKAIRLATQRKELPLPTHLTNQMVSKKIMELLVRYMQRK